MIALVVYGSCLMAHDSNLALNFGTGTGVTLATHALAHHCGNQSGRRSAKQTCY